MSYSYGATGATKDQAKANIKAKLDDVTANQPQHAADIAAVQALCNDFIDSLQPDDREISVTVHGSVSWKGTGKEPPFGITEVDANISVKYISSSN